MEPAQLPERTPAHHGSRTMAHFSFSYDEPAFSFKAGKVTVTSDIFTNGDSVTYADTYVYVGDVPVVDYDEPYTVDSPLLAGAWNLIDIFY
jgi:hypothetical protein